MAKRTQLDIDRLVNTVLESSDKRQVDDLCNILDRIFQGYDNGPIQVSLSWALATLMKDISSPDLPPPVIVAIIGQLSFRMFFDMEAQDEARKN